MGWAGLSLARRLISGHFLRYQNIAMNLSMTAKAGKRRGFFATSTCRAVTRLTTSFRTSPQSFGAWLIGQRDKLRFRRTGQAIRRRCSTMPTSSTETSITRAAPLNHATPSRWSLGLILTAVLSNRSNTFQTRKPSPNTESLRPAWLRLAALAAAKRIERASGFCSKSKQKPRQSPSRLA